MTTYPQEFKDQLVDLHRSGRTFMELGKEFNLAPTSISNWVRAAERAEQEAKRHTDGGESDAAKIRRIVIMGGSARVGYSGKAPPEPEWNIKLDPPAARAVA